jgi:hypothetical protein
MRYIRNASGRLLLFSALFLGVAPLWADSIATVESFKGYVEKRLPGAIAWDKLYIGDKLAGGSAVRTQPGGSLDLKTHRGHRLHLREDTTLELTSLEDNQTQGQLEKGSVVSSVKHLKSDERFSIQTPTAVCAVRGTEFETRATSEGTWVAVFRGIVGVSASGGGEETAVHAGQMTSVRHGAIELPHAIPRENRLATDSALAHAARHEVALDMTRNQVIAAAAEERRFADYQEGKSLIDVNGQRVRIEEYVVRPQPNQFKLVALDERGQSQLDYFFYQGTFNKNLPTDLSVALKDVAGKFGATAPDYYLTGYEMGQSNTQDSVHDTASGGHLVQMTLDPQGNYTLDDHNGNTRIVPAAQLQSDGTYKVYNPLADSFATVSAGQLASATQFGVYLPENNAFKDLAPGDSLWKTRFNAYEHDIDGNMKQMYTKTASALSVLSSPLDANWSYAGGFVLPVVQPDPNNVDATVTNYYGDGTFEQYRTVLIDDQGSVAPLSAFAGLSSGSAYKQELLKWNYEQQVSATEFQGRKIDLVVEPRIFIESGLIQ